MNVLSRLARSRLAEHHPVRAPGDDARGRLPYVATQQLWDAGPPEELRRGVAGGPRRGWPLCHPRELMEGLVRTSGVSTADAIVALDIETTGLGAGTVPFVVGALVGEVRADRWTLRQWTLQTMGGEAAMLQDVMGSLGALRSYVLLTYNGKSFDLPVLRGRTQRVGMDAFALHGPHVDLLHPARRLWNTGRGSCRLQRLERDRWGIVRRDDIAGAEIPEVFWAQLASRGAPDTSERMSRVLRHNALDLWSVAAVCEEVVHRLGRPTSLREALAATHRSAQQSPARIIALLQPWLQRAALPTVGLCAERALLASGFQVLVKAQRAVADHLGAVRTLEQWLAVAPGDPRASTQLAMVLERDCRDLEGALRAAAQSREPSVRRIGRLQRRLQAQRTARDASPKGGTGRPSTAGRGRLRSSS